MRGKGPGRGRPPRHEPAAPLAGLTVPFTLVLLAQGGARHGYALRDELEGGGLLPYVDFGNLYRTLRRMEEAGLLSSRWEVEDAGPGRRMYAITADGRQALEQFAESLRKARQALDRFFAAYGAIRAGAEGSGAE